MNRCLHIRPSWITAGCTGLVVAGGLVVLIGWARDVAWLKSAIPGTPAMAAHAAACFIASGLALWLLGSPHPTLTRRLVGSALSAIPIVIAAATLIEYATHLDLGIDHLFFAEPGAIVPGRMAPITALGFILAGSSLLLLNSRVVLAQSAAAGLGFLVVLSLIGYLFDIPALYRVGPRSLSPNAMALFLAMTLGLLAARPRHGLTAVLTSDTPAGMVARRLFPAVLSVPIFLGWLELEGVRRGYYDAGFAKGLFAAINIAAFAGLIWWNLRVLERTERARRRAEKELRETEERFRTLVESSPNAIIMTAPDGGISLVNRQAETLFGFTRQELLGQTIETLVPGRFRTRHAAYRHDFQTHPQQRPMGAGRDLFALRKDGTEVPVEIGLTPISRPDGVHTMANIIDITERKRGEHALRKTAAELVRSNQELEQFAHVASHDLQEPLRMITGHLRLIERRLGNAIDEPTSESFHYAVDGAERMQAMIRDLLAYARVGRQEGAFVDIDMDALVQLVLHNLAAGIEETGAVIRCDALPTLKADHRLMTQLFQNLLSNAIKYRSEHRRPEVVVAAQKQEGAWLFHVKDNGIGIDRDNVDRIFQMFQRLHTRHKYPGTGIGLALCKKIVEYHGGRIWVESAPGEGSTFFFTIPEHSTPGT